MFALKLSSWNIIQSCFKRECAEFWLPAGSRTVPRRMWAEPLATRLLVCDQMKTSDWMTATPTIMYTIIYCNKATSTLHYCQWFPAEDRSVLVCVHTHTPVFCCDRYQSPELSTPPQHVQLPSYQHESISQKHLQRLNGGAGCVHQSVCRTGQRSRKRLNKGRPVRGQVTRTHV